jgi:hypothetical protein
MLLGEKRTFGGKLVKWSVTSEENILQILTQTDFEGQAQ